MNRFEGHFSGDFVDNNVILFTCLQIIEEELQHVVHLWNTHRIHPCRYVVAPHGRPLLMDSLPQLYGTRDHLKGLSQQQIQACREEGLQRGPYPCHETVFYISCFAMAENNLPPHTTPNEAIKLYVFLRAYMLAHL
ncbi:hypothetical protein J4Q44_G00320830 [Coregonus suidteri]|uniref:Uncharacterized protein n=1 Tax=Coregonus suidteri TaxID=861788 RepID=A0AAN8QAD5_9TELE